MSILTFNVRHPIWVQLDETRGEHKSQNARWIMHLQEWLTLQVLSLLAAYPDPQDFDERRHLIDNQLRLYVEMFIKPTTRQVRKSADFDQQRPVSNWYGAFPYIEIKILPHSCESI